MKFPKNTRFLREIDRQKHQNSAVSRDSISIIFQIRIRISRLDSGTRISDSNLDALRWANLKVVERISNIEKSKI